KADYSQIELRIAAKITGDSRMLEAYAKGEDLHTLTARRMTGKEEVSKEERQVAKPVNFGLIYGMGARALCGKAKSDYGIDLSLEQAEAYRRAFFRTYAGVKRWHRSFAEGTVETRTLAGRRRLGVDRFTFKANTPVQGTGADGLKLALALLWERRHEMPGAFPVLGGHGETGIECAA